ncbi:MAG: ATP-binding protein, partial [Polyangiaceae bacterium]
MTGPGDARAVVSLTLSFQPLAEQIGSLRSAVSDLCRPYLTDPDQLSRVLLAAHELLENIVKYSIGSSAEFHVALEASDARLRVRLRTKNRAHPDRLDDARRRLDALCAASDPVAHYDDLIRASAGRRDVSGLGL